MLSRRKDWCRNGFCRLHRDTLKRHLLFSPTGTNIAQWPTSDGFSICPGLLGHVTIRRTRQMQDGINDAFVLVDLWTALVDTAVIFTQDILEFIVFR